MAEAEIQRDFVSITLSDGYLSIENKYNFFSLKESHLPYNSRVIRFKMLTITVKHTSQLCEGTLKHIKLVEQLLNDGVQLSLVLTGRSIDN